MPQPGNDEVATIRTFGWTTISCQPDALLNDQKHVETDALAVFGVDRERVDWVDLVDLVCEGVIVAR